MSGAALAPDGNSSASADIQHTSQINSASQGPDNSVGSRVLSSPDGGPEPGAPHSSSKASTPKDPKPARSNSTDKDGTNDLEHTPKQLAEVNSSYERRDERFERKTCAGENPGTKTTTGEPKSAESKTLSKGKATRDGPYSDKDFSSSSSSSSSSSITPRESTSTSSSEMDFDTTAKALRSGVSAGTSISLRSRTTSEKRKVDESGNARTAIAKSVMVVDGEGSDVAEEQNNHAAKLFYLIDENVARVTGSVIAAPRNSDQLNLRLRIELRVSHDRAHANPGWRALQPSTSSSTFSTSLPLPSSSPTSQPLLSLKGLEQPLSPQETLDAAGAKEIYEEEQAEVDDSLEDSDAEDVSIDAVLLDLAARGERLDEVQQELQDLDTVAQGDTATLLYTQRLGQDLELEGCGRKITVPRSALVPCGRAVGRQVTTWPLAKERAPALPSALVRVTYNKDSKGRVARLGVGQSTTCTTRN
ncbi:hypothetical protein V8E36_003009 [Tilletia maclaganii]